MINIELSYTQHAYVIAFLPNRGEKEVMKYIFAVASNYNNALPEDQLITVSVPEKLVIDIYATMGLQQERLTYTMNEQIRVALLPQIAQSADIANGIVAVATQNANDLAQILAQSKNFLQEIRS